MHAPASTSSRLAETISLAVRFLDNVIDRNRFPLPHIDRMTKQTRKIGLGIMGFADLLIALNIPYNSEAALQTATTLMEFFRSRAHLASAGLAAERGVFPAYRGSRLQTLHQRHRNATVTTIAPTGSISLIAGCSPGIEPLYGVQEVRRIMDGDRAHLASSSLRPARTCTRSRSRLTSARPGGSSFDSTCDPYPRRAASTYLSRRMMSHPNIMCVCKPCFSDIATAVSRKPSICRPRRPKPK